MNTILTLTDCYCKGNYALTDKLENTPSLRRLKHNKPISTVAIDTFFKILNCDVNNIVLYVAEKEAKSTKKRQGD